MVTEYEELYLQMDKEKDKDKCPHCVFCSKIFPENATNREYWIMTEIFTYLHGTDECNGMADHNIKTMLKRDYK